MKLENINFGSGGGCGGGHQARILFCVYHQLRENSAVQFGADTGRGELMYLLNLFSLHHQEIPRVFRPQDTLNGKLKISPAALGISLVAWAALLLCRSCSALWELSFLGQYEN